MTWSRLVRALNAFSRGELSALISYLRVISFRGTGVLERASYLDLCAYLALAIRSHV